MNRTKIEWTDFTWNPIVGCTYGCKWCYARRLAKRQGSNFWPTFHRDRLGEPHSKKQPSKIFVCSMGELFDPVVSFEEIAEIHAVMWMAERHTFQVLTKQPRRAMEFYREWNRYFVAAEWPLPNAQLGISAIDQYSFDKRWSYLSKIQANVRFVSYEPALGPLDLSDVFGLYEYDENKWALKTSSRWEASPNWVIVGSQTGPGAVSPQRKWVHSIIEQCRAAGVPLFMKCNLASVWQGELIQEYPK